MGISTYKTYISEFLFRWPKFRSILRPLHYKAMGEKSNLFFTYQARLFYHELSYDSLLLMIQVQILVGDRHKVHLGS